MGISLALLWGMAAGWLLMAVAYFSTIEIPGRFLRDGGKWGALSGRVFNFNFGMNLFEFKPALAGDAIPRGIGMASFLITPSRYLSQLSGYLPRSRAEGEKDVRQQQLVEIITGRLNEMANVFNDLAQSFTERCSLEENGGVDLYSLLDKVCNSVCQHCNGYEKCWGEHFYATYREVFDLIALAELNGEAHAHHLRGKLGKNCFQQYKLISMVNRMVERYQSDQYWQRKFAEGKFMVTVHLQGISDFFIKLASEIVEDSLFRLELETKLKNGFTELGIFFKELSVHSQDEVALEIRVKKRSCNQKQECQCLVAPLIGNLLGKEYMIWEKRCHLANEECFFCMIPKFAYEVKTTVCKLPKAGNEFSGDSHALRELKDGHFVAILSDGMGHGSKAALESDSTVNILEKLLDNGVERDFAIKMVNSLIALRSPEESFTTVDLAIIDLYNGAAEFLKIGAAVTYVKRGREIMAIRSTSLPAGILNTVDVEKTAVTLQAGDLVVLATDGVVDSRPDTAGKEEWIKRALSKVEVVGPEALGEYLLNLAKINQDGAPKDDMTVIVLQIIERSDREDEGVT